MPTPTEPFDDVRRIAVLRAGHLGDLVLALPALEALAAAYPSARITLLGRPEHAELMRDRPGPVHDVAVVPVVPGVRDDPRAEPDPTATAAFLADMADRRFDLAVQLHGGGASSNPFVRQLGARHTLGSRSPGAEPLDRSVAYGELQHEVLRMLEVVALAGAPPVTAEPRLVVTDAERRSGRAHRAGDRRPLAVLHPAASDPRRRWPADRFAAVSAALASTGVRTLVVGTAAEAAVAEAVVERAHHLLPPGRRRLVSSRAGRLRLTELVGLLATADLLVGNDSGPRHLAHAVGTPTVAVYWIGNVVTYAPPSRDRHRVHVSWRTHCPVCGEDNLRDGLATPRCPHDASFVSDVPVTGVVADALQLLDAST